MLIVSGAPTSVGHELRVINACRALGECGWPVAWRAIGDLTPDAIALAGELVLAYRVKWTEGFGALCDACRARSIPMVYDIGDLIFDPELMRGHDFAYLDDKPAEVRQAWIDDAVGYRRALCACDAVIATNVPLADAAAALVPHAYVVPNALTAEFRALADALIAARPDAPPDALTRLGYASGTPTHRRDFAVMVPALATALAADARLRLVVVGYLALDDYPALQAVRDQIEQRARVPFAQFPHEVARYDISLAPSEVGNPFCEAKSDFRMIIASGLAIPTIASPIRSMRDAIDHGATGLLASSTPDWVAAITALAHDPDRRIAMGEAARAAADVHIGWTAYRRLIDSACRAVVERQ